MESKVEGICKKCIYGKQIKILNIIPKKNTWKCENKGMGEATFYSPLTSCRYFTPKK